MYRVVWGCLTSCTYRSTKCAETACAQLFADSTLAMLRHMRGAHELIGLLRIQLSSYNVEKCRELSLILTIADVYNGAIPFKRIQRLNDKLHVLE